MSAPHAPAGQPPVRELSEATLPEWLAARGLVSRPAEARVRLLTGGVSNLAFWVDRPEGPCVVKQARPRLAVQMEWRADVRRVIREGEAMAWLRERIGPPAVPALYHLDRREMVLVMEAVPPPAENYKARMLRGVVEPDLAERFGALLAAIHRATGDAATAERFADTRFFDELRLSPYYDTVARRHPAAAPRLADLRAECLERAYCLVHGDYSPKNILVHGGELVLLDYEVAHWGNPSFDLGFALTHYLAKALHLAEAGHGPGFVECAQRFWAAYQAGGAVPVEAVARAGWHLAAVLLARMDGKSPLEYFTDAGKQDIVRTIATEALTAATPPAIDQVIDAVEARLP